MKPIFLSILLMIFLVACSPSSKPDRTDQKMDSIMTDFSVQWKKDSLGENGFRISHYSWDSIAKVRLINGLNFQGYTETEIIKWLGHPEFSGRHFEDNGLIMEYPVGQDHNRADRTLLIYFDPEDKVSSIIEKIGIGDTSIVPIIIKEKNDSVVNIKNDSISLTQIDTIKEVKKYKKVKNPFKKLEYDKVVAYDYDRGKSEPGVLIVMDGELAPSIKKKKKLTQKQIDDFINFVSAPSTYGEVTAFCFDPHLGIVFYKNDTVVAHLSICLECNYLASSIHIPATEVKKIKIGDDFEYGANGFSKEGRQKISALCEQLNFSHCEDRR